MTGKQRQQGVQNSACSREGNQPCVLKPPHIASLDQLTFFLPGQPRRHVCDLLSVAASLDCD